MKSVIASFLLILAAASALVEVNVGDQKPEATLPFNVTAVSDFALPWRIAFLPDGRMLVTEKIGPIWLVSAEGEKIAPLGNMPRVYWQGQNGMLGVDVSPRYATDQSIYITNIEPGEIWRKPSPRPRQTQPRPSAQIGERTSKVIRRETPRAPARNPAAKQPATARVFTIPFSVVTPYARPRPQPARRQDPPPNPRRQAGSWQSQLRQEIGASTIQLIVDPPRDTDAAEERKAR
ncbi:MAG: PQQ-dependent sugar dehydrogenase [Bryobacterales bacterium]|nr:PQQ-dependent sugar dehydrogenase [Bryobacterales bacterium]